MRRGLTITAAILLTTVALYAAASYPSGVKSFSTKLAGQTISAAHVNDIQDELVAVEDGLLNGVAHALKPSVSSAQDLGTSALPWGKARVGGVQLTDATTLTLATDAITVTQSYHAIETEGAAATDNCATITAGTGVAAGFIVVLRAADITHVVTVKDGTGNLLLNGDYVMNTTDRTITLIYDGTNWRELGRSATAATTATLLKAGSGTSTAAAATNVDTIAITGLTALDQLLVHVTLSESTQAVARVDLYSQTDTTVISRLSSGGSISAGVAALTKTVIMQDQSAATIYNSDVTGGTTGGTVAEMKSITGLTAWTTGFTLALRHGGITAGGTLRWTWAVYVLRGQ